MLDEKLMEVLTSPPDSALAIVTQGPEGPHVVNSWNSYARIFSDGSLLLPAGRMHQTQANLERDNRVKLTITNREVQGKSYKGTGFLITGTAQVVDSGPKYDLIKDGFPWARAALSITVQSADQTL